jgi:hypothetical protein
MQNEAVIFLLENSTDYLFLLDQAFRKGQVKNRLRVARYGNEAILYLKGVGIYGDRKQYPLPSIVVIDMAVPDGSGPAVLGWIRRQTGFDAVPIIILIHPSQNLFLKDFEMSPNTYCAARDDFEGLVQLLKSFERTEEPHEGDWESQPERIFQ